MGTPRRPSASRRPCYPRSLWAEVLAVAATPAQAARLAQRLLHLKSILTKQALTQPIRRLLQRAVRQPGVLRGPLLALLAAQLPLVVPAQPPSTKAITPSADSRPQPLPTSSRPKPMPPEPAPDETVYLTNAGLVLLWPFFTLLFERLGYLVQLQFEEAALADRAVHLLQFLVMGDDNSLEHYLVLNKLLCGVAQAHLLPRAGLLTPEEKTTGEDLLRAVLGQWAVLKNTSIAGLRETFLQRSGRLTWHPDKVVLTVETKTMDILLDQCPWSIALIKLPWMALPLYVTWR